MDNNDIPKAKIFPAKALAILTARPLSVVLSVVPALTLSPLSLSLAVFVPSAT